MRTLDLLQSRKERTRLAFYRTINKNKTFEKIEERRKRLETKKREDSIIVRFCDLM